MAVKYKAPAVHQAIETLELLITRGPCSLQRIAESTGFSKATLLRILETMEAHGWVTRDNAKKTFDSAVLVTFRDGSNPEMDMLLQDIFDELSESCGHTVEWYQLREKGSTITLRSVPAESQVMIRARLGYVRPYNWELEVVTRMALASGAADYKKVATRSGYHVIKNGKHVPVSLKQTGEIIEATDCSKVCFDTEWNSNGIRRHAVAVMKPDGKVFGILALATAFTPSANDEIENLHKQLEITRNKIEKILKARKVKAPAGAAKQLEK